MTFLLFLLLWRWIPRFCHLNLGDAARGEYAVSVRHAARDEASNAPRRQTFPALWILAARRQGHRGGRHSCGRRGGDGPVAVGHRLLLQLLAAVLLQQFWDGKPPLANLRGTGGTQWAATSSNQWAVDACSDLNHVVHNAIVLGVVWEAESETIF